ncbi:cupin domain-containing protein [Chitinophaga niabensis]|uniref:Mannose-6-phosphate isomerase, cupin superfamily n=1 Tax=Chitinophaga niabensis TaxID=536979 RepID=A0A1N6J688_9BACT|nr:cupin domain-containing protein [Chitinophaga niabensis]SIO39908.1 Mannose-6-phosphate isomerase, cupin superfamily [Chitinophaga niabensis]
MSLPRTISNPIIGDKVTFLETTEETGGSHVTVIVELAPGGKNGLHFHTTYKEKFEVMEGELGLRIGKGFLFLSRGGMAEVPLYERHLFFNPSGKRPVTFKVTITPARQFEACLRVAYGLATDGKVRKGGIPLKLTHLAILMEMGETYLTFLPYWLQVRLFRYLGRIARRRGVLKELEPYYKS